jgi:hypothetical protein
MRKAAISAALMAMLLGGIPAAAHHSFAATYFENKTLTIQGKVVRFLYRNPHSFVQVEAKDDKGVMQKWAVEWGGSGQLSRVGVTAESLHPGDMVTVTGNPGRNTEDYRLRVLSIKCAATNFAWKGVVE